MGRIQSSIGLITGTPIADTVDQLIALSAKPRDLIVARNDQLQKEQVAVTQLSALLTSLQYAADQLGQADLFDAMSASSSDPSALSVEVTGQPQEGAYQFTPVRQAQNHQLLSSGVASPDAPLDPGAFSFRFGRRVDHARSLSDLNGGRGVQRGVFRITDRSGADALIDLRFAATVDDVLDAINGNGDINVRAVAHGDAIELIDETGLSLSNLKVQDIGVGSTAADLGLAGIDTASNSATGLDVLQLHNGLALNQLNDGNGVSLRAGLPDLEITFRDGSSPLQIDLDLAAGEQATLGDLLDALNQADPARLSARISADGDRIELTDLTADTGGVFAVSSPLGGGAAEDLGVTGTSAGGVLTSRRLQAGLRSALLSSLGGGAGLGELGQLDLTDRAGAAASVDLSAAESLDDVIAAINGAGLGLEARVNDAGDGLLLADTTGQTGHLTVQSGDAANTAEKLGIAVDDAVASVDSGSLRLQVVSEHTALDSLNNGRGVARRSFLITDSSGASGAVNLAVSNPVAIGDVLDEINSLGIGVEARINDAGDGILLIDTAGGAGALRVEDSSGTAAADLHLAGESTIQQINGQPTQVIDGATSYTIQIEAGDTLQDLADKIQQLDAGVSAAILHDGSGAAPYRLSLISGVPGKAGQMLVHADSTALDFQEVTPAQDALMTIGSASASGAGVLVVSSSNEFDSVLEGATLTIHQPSAAPVTVFVEQSGDSLVSTVRDFVDQFNSLKEKIDDLTFFNETDNSTGILFGSGEVLRIETSLGRMLTGRFSGAGDVDSLGELGISLGEDGKLSLDEQKLRERFAEDPEAVRQFFTDEQFGASAKLSSLIDSLAGQDSSLLASRTEALQAKIDANNEHIDSLNSRLDNERERLLTEFYRMEAIIAKMKNGLNALNAIQPLPPLASSQTQS